MVRVKICGITNWDDAADAVDAGADALGFVMAASPRRIEPGQARAIIDRLPPFVATVGVLVGEPPNEAVSKLAESGCRIAQLHGDWPQEVWSALRPWPTIRAVKIGTQVPPELPDMDGAAAILLDTYRQGLEGGTGASFDWNLARKIPLGNRPLILAGGLTPENVADAIAAVRPYAVDVSSGVEAVPGRKDPAKMRRFVQAAHAASGIRGERSHAAR